MEMIWAEMQILEWLFVQVCSIVVDLYFENLLQDPLVTFTGKKCQLRFGTILFWLQLPFSSSLCLASLWHQGFFSWKVCFQTDTNNMTFFLCTLEVLLITYAIFLWVHFIPIPQEKVTRNSIYNLQSAWPLFLLLMVIKSQR